MPGSAFDRRSLPSGLTINIWTAPDDWRLRSFEWRQTGRGPARGSLLFQSGRADFLEKYLESLWHWHERGWNIAGFDWRGQGGSVGDEPPSGGLDRLLDDLAGFVGEWSAEAPRPHVAVGHSMGGHLLLRMLAERADEIDAAVLVAPMLGLNSHPIPPRVAAALARRATMLGWGQRPLWRPGRRATGIGSGRQVALTGDPYRYADEAHWLAATPAFAAGGPRWDWLAAAYASIAGLTAPGVLETVTTPVLLIGTTRDRLVDAAAIRAAAERLPNARLVMRDDSAHEMLRERDAVRDQVLATIDAFLDEVVPA